MGVIGGSHEPHDVTLMTRIDRLEQPQEPRAWHFRALWTAVLSLATAVAVMVIRMILPLV